MICIKHLHFCIINIKKVHCQQLSVTENKLWRFEGGLMIFVWLVKRNHHFSYGVLFSNENSKGVQILFFAVVTVLYIFFFFFHLLVDVITLFANHSLIVLFNKRLEEIPMKYTVENPLIFFFFVLIMHVLWNICCCL